MRKLPLDALVWLGSRKRVHGLRSSAWARRAPPMATSSILKAHGKSAPVNKRMVELALAIEMGALAPQPSNASLLTKSAVVNG
jgi:hypothetical protein